MNPEQPRQRVLFFVTPLAVLMAAFMFFFFSQDEWTTNRVIGQLGFSVIAFGLLITTLFPVRGWWGIRLVTLTIFLTYSSYLIDQLWFSEETISLSGNFARPTPMNSVLGFLVWGLPSLFYTLWGSLSGRLHYLPEAGASLSDVVAHIIAWIAQAIFLILVAAIAFTAIFRWVSNL